VNEFPLPFPISAYSPSRLIDATAVPPLGHQRETRTDQLDEVVLRVIQICIYSKVHSDSTKLNKDVKKHINFEKNVTKQLDLLKL
jgi:hypothetical protein